MNVSKGTVDHSIRFWAYDSGGAAVTGEAYNSVGMSISVIVRRKGRIVSTTGLTLIARSVSGVHEDSALAEVGNGEYVLDLPDSYFTTDGDYVSLSVSSANITTAIIDNLTVQDAPATSTSTEQIETIVKTISSNTQ